MCLLNISETRLGNCKEQQSKRYYTKRLHRIYVFLFVPGFLNQKNTTCSIPIELFWKLHRSIEYTMMLKMFLLLSVNVLWLNRKVYREYFDSPTWKFNNLTEYKALWYLIIHCYELSVYWYLKTITFYKTVILKKNSKNLILQQI